MPRKDNKNGFTPLEITGNNERYARSRKSLTGFTLIEIVVAVAVFVFAIVAVSGIFLSVVKAQRKASIAGKIQSEGRAAMEDITAAVRNYSIDYSVPISNPASTLALVRPDNQKVSFFKGTDNRLKMQIGATGTPMDFLSDKVKVDNLKFWMIPVSDPFVLGGPDEQPRVTITLTLSQSKVTTQPEEQASIQVQTTVMQRVYKR